MLYQLSVETETNAHEDTGKFIEEWSDLSLTMGSGFTMDPATF